MPLRADVVRKKLLQIDQASGRIRSWLPISVDPTIWSISVDRLERDLQLQWAIERGLQIAAEALFDTGNHILASAFQESVDEHRDIPKRLAARGVLRVWAKITWHFGISSSHHLRPLLNREILNVGQATPAVSLNRSRPNLVQI